MTDLVVCLGEEKGGRAYVSKLIESEGWERVFIVAAPSAKDGFSAKKPAEFFLIDESKTIPEMASELFGKMHGKFGLEVALNMASGSGKQHMAILSALLKSGVGIRLAALTPKGVKEI